MDGSSPLSRISEFVQTVFLPFDIRDDLPETAKATDDHLQLHLMGPFQLILGCFKNVRLRVNTVILVNIA